MKKPFLLIIIFLAFKTFGQYPLPQSIGSPNTIVFVPANGGFQAGIINRTFTDTSTANSTTYLDNYAAAVIFTTGNNTYWIRNATATAWINVATGSSGGGGNTSITNIYNNSIVGGTIINDTCLSIDLGNGSHVDTVCSSIVIQNYNFINDSQVVICGYIPPDTVTSVCDTFNFNGGGHAVYLFQNGLHQHSAGITHWGGDLIENTTINNWNSLLKFHMYKIYDIGFLVDNENLVQLGTALQGWKGRGYYYDCCTNSGGNMILNNVRSAMQYVGGVYTHTPSLYNGFFGDSSIGYAWTTNAYNITSGGVAVDDGESSKTTAILQHTTDTDNNYGIDFYVAAPGTSTGNQYPILSPNQGLKNYLVGRMLTTGQWRYPKYGVGTFTGTPAYTLQVDANGNIIEGSFTGGGFTTADNGLTANTATNVRMGGSLIMNTNISTGGSDYNFGIGKTLTLSAGTLNYSFINNNTVSGNENFVPGKNMVVAGNTNFAAATDGQVFSTANYSATFGDAPKNKGIAALTGGFNGYNYVENGLTIGNDLVNGANVTDGSGTANLYKSSQLFGGQSRSVGSFNMVAGRAVFANNTASSAITGGIILFGSGINSTNTRLTASGGQRFAVGFNSDTATLMVFPASGAGTFGQTLLNGEIKAGTVAHDDTQARVLVWDSVTHTIDYRDGGNLLGDLGVPISSLKPAMAINEIDNTNYTQLWKWNSLTTQGLQLTTTSTAAQDNSQSLLFVEMQGANSNSNQRTTGIWSQNFHTGTGSTNYGVYGDAANGTTNAGIYGTSSYAGGYGVYGHTEYNNAIGVYAENTFPSAGTAYGLKAATTGATTTGIAGYFTATGATNNYSIIVPSGGGQVGIGLSSGITATRLQVVDNNLTSSQQMARFASSSTGGSDLELVRVEKTGANASSGQTTYGLVSVNLTTGTTSTNYGLVGIAYQGTTNYGVNGATAGAGAGIYGYSSANVGYGGYFTHTSTASGNKTAVLIDNNATGGSINIGAQIQASNATSNYAIIVPSGGGKVGIGTSTPTASRLEVVDNSTPSSTPVSFTSNIASASSTFSVANTGTGKGMSVTSVDDVGLHVTTTNSFAISANSTAANALSAATQAGVPITGTINAGSNSSTNTGLSLVKAAASAADGIGVSVVFSNSNTTGGINQSNEIISKWSTAALATRTSQFVVTGVNSTTTRTLMNISGTGETTLGVAGTQGGYLSLTGNTSGTVSIKTQAAAGTYNFNLPTSAGNSTELLTSAGGGTSAMTWTPLKEITLEEYTEVDLFASSFTIPNATTNYNRVVVITKGDGTNTIDFPPVDGPYGQTITIIVAATNATNAIIGTGTNPAPTNAAGTAFANLLNGKTYIFKLAINDDGNYRWVCISNQSVTVD